MNLSVCIVFVAVLGNSIQCVSGIIHHDENSGTKSKSYFDFWKAVTLQVQHAGNQNQQYELKDLNDELFKFYQHLIVQLKSQRGLENNFDRNTSMSLFPSVVEFGETNTYSLLNLKDSLKQANENLTSSCINDTGRLIVNLLNGKSWAFQFFDSTGKPGPSLSENHLYFLGNYDQCRKASAPPGDNGKGFKGNYCNAGAPNPAAFSFLGIGVCLPSTCSSEEVTSLIRDILKAINVSSIPVEAVAAECRSAPTEVTTATVFSIVILCLVGAMVILGTIFDFITFKMRESRSLPLSEVDIDSTGHQNGYSRFSSDRKDGDPSADSKATSIAAPKANDESKSALVKVLVAFSVYTNGKKLLNTSQAPGSLGAIHGIRFLSMSWVVLCHICAQILLIALNGSTFMLDFINRWTALPILNGFSSVDTFFTLSGLLTSYLTIKEMRKINSWKINWPLFYFHRFWRLTPPYMFSLLITLGLTQYMGHGPLWANKQPADRDFCEKNWWTNLLYINNLVKLEESCFGHSWYLANDMQFFVVSPLMLIPFHFHQMAGLLSCFVFLLVQTITAGALSSVNDWPTTTLVHTEAQIDWSLNYYITPWCRIGPFVVGTIAGYILAQTKGKEFKMPLWCAVLGWVVFVASGLAVVYGLKGDIMGDNPSSRATSALYNALSRPVWGACVSWVVIACSAGYGGPVNALLSWSPFVFLGKLTYMSYLIHLTVVGVVFNSMGSQVYMNDILLVTLFLGLLILVNMVSFVAVLVLESPMLGLEKAFIRKEKMR